MVLKNSGRRGPYLLKTDTLDITERELPGSPDALAMATC